MTKRISSSFARSTTKVKARKEATSGPPTEIVEGVSVPTSKRWYVSMDDGTVWAYDMRGTKDARISFGRGMHGAGGEVRIYRDSNTKVYDAVITGVKSIVSEHVRVERLYGGEHQSSERALSVEAIEKMFNSTEEKKAEAEVLPIELQDPLSLIGLNESTPESEEDF